jgi:hypothetical protein
MDIRLWLDVVGTTCIVVGGVLALLQLRHTQKQRTRELALQMLRSFQTPEFLTAGNLVYELPEGLSKAQIEKRVRAKVTCLLVMLGTFESLGILVYRRDIDIGLVEDFFGGILIMSGRKLSLYIDDMRRLSGRDTYYEWAQWLSEQVKRREAHRPALPAHVEFRDWEARA